MKTKSTMLRQFARKADRIAAQLDSLEMAPVGEIARKWGTTKEYVRRNVPIVKLGPKTHRVKLEDAMDFQTRRTQKNMNNQKTKLAALFFALALTAMPQNAQAQGGWFLKWKMHGGMVGNFDVAYRLRGTEIVIGVAAPPAGATCQTPWSWSFSNSASGTNCYHDLPLVVFEFVIRPHSGGSWVVVDTFSLADTVGPECCDAPPPQNCIGDMAPGIFSGPCF